MDLADQEHYRVHLDADKDELFISKPVIGRTTGRMTIQLSRRLDNPDGSFGGAIVASIDQSNLSRFYDSIDVGKDGAIVVIGLDRVIRASRGFKTVNPDGFYQGLALFEKLRESPTGFYANHGIVDGTIRLVSYRKIESLPLVVTVALAQHEVFADYWRERGLYYIAATVLTVVILITIGLGAWRKQKLIVATSAMQQAQEALARSQERYTLVESAVNDGIWDWNILTGEAYMSPRWKHILGYADDELPNLASSFFDNIHPDDKAAVTEASRAQLEENKPYSLDFRLRCKNGDYCWVNSRGQAVRDATNRPVRMLGITTDITARKQAEAVLARTNQELEMRVAERTAALAQEMRKREEAQMTLAQMQKMEAVGQLTAGIAHDFNNLLAVIRGSLEFIEREAARGLTAEPELIDAATRATRRGSELVQRLLAFSRQSPLKAEPTRIDQLVLDTLRLLQRTLGAEIDIVTQLSAMTAAVSVDRSQLANALVNLALNARDAMPEGGEITIATTCRPSSWAAAEGASRWPTGEEVCITISDTGVGMTGEVRARVFEPFFTTKKDGLGTGLGLSMVHGFVEQSGGHIDIDSAPGRGTTITLHLPKIDMASHAAESGAVDGLSATGREKVVLLVEDDPDVRIVTAAQLKQLGYKVHAVADGMAAIDMIESPAHIDITLTDIVLPGGIDGVTLLKEAMRMRPNMGVLCMSGYDPTQKHRKWFQVQNIELLEKPFASARLAQALDDVLAH
jgi:PAS domain S-box-containing protein